MLRLTFPFSRDVEGEGGRGGPWRICAYEVHVCARTRLRLCNVCVCTVVRGASSLRSILTFLDLLSPVNLETWFYVYGARGHRRVRDARPSTRRRRVSILTHSPASAYTMRLRTYLRIRTYPRIRTRRCDPSTRRDRRTSHVAHRNSHRPCDDSLSMACFDLVFQVFEDNEISAKRNKNYGD